jgi:predicted ATPase
MLRKFTANNFKSLINVTYEPGAVNLLVGQNNSGKTNLCQALRFLSETSHQGREIWDIWRDAIGIDLLRMRNVYFDHPTIDLGCTCDITGDNSEPLIFYYSLNLDDITPTVVTERLQISGGKFGPGSVTLLENEAGKIRLLNEGRYLKGETPDACYQNTTAKVEATMLSRLHDWQANRWAMAFRDHLSGWQYYDLDPYRLRDDRFDPQAHELNPDGSNLASVLFDLKNRDERHYRLLIELAQKLERRLDALNFTTVGERIEMELTDTQDHRFGLKSASNGTLRFVALCYIILSNARWAHPPLTIIEEPENGLYVRCLKPLLQLIDPSGAGGQYIFTSHSPYFIDEFEDHLDNVTLMQDQGTYSALVKSDPARVHKYLEEMPLGELHFREMLA